MSSVNSHCLAINSQNKKNDAGHDYQMQREYKIVKIAHWALHIPTSLTILRTKNTPHLSGEAFRLNEKATKLTVDRKYEFK